MDKKETYTKAEMLEVFDALINMAAPLAMYSQKAYKQIGEDSYHNVKPEGHDLRFMKESLDNLEHFNACYGEVFDNGFVLGE